MEFRRFCYAARFVFFVYFIKVDSFLVFYLSVPIVVSVSFFFSPTSRHIYLTRDRCQSGRHQPKGTVHARTSTQRGGPIAQTTLHPKCLKHKILQPPFLEYNDCVSIDRPTCSFIPMNLSLLLRIFPTYGLHEGRLHQGTTTESRCASAPTSVPPTCLKHFQNPLLFFRITMTLRQNVVDLYFISTSHGGSGKKSVEKCCGV